MSEGDVDRFRIQAEECRQLAEQSTNSVDREAWLKLADDWITLAQDIEAGARRQANASED
jgi:hypothetical protein